MRTPIVLLQVFIRNNINEIIPLAKPNSFIENCFGLQVLGTFTPQIFLFIMNVCSWDRAGIASCPFAFNLKNRRRIYSGLDIFPGNGFPASGEFLDCLNKRPFPFTRPPLALMSSATCSGENFSSSSITWKTRFQHGQWLSAWVAGLPDLHESDFMLVSGLNLFCGQGQHRIGPIPDSRGSPCPMFNGAVVGRFAEMM